MLSNTDLSKPIPKVLIIDKIGILSSLYDFSDIAFVGGGFSGKLHNILEAGVKGNIIIFGPKTENYPEAELLVNKNLAFKNECIKYLKIGLTYGFIYGFIMGTIIGPFGQRNGI